MYHNDLPPCMTAHIVKLQPSYNLRNRLRLEIPPFKSNIKKYNSISYRGPILWNHMPIECRNANSVKSFSRMINRLTLVREIDFSNLFRRRSSFNAVFRSKILSLRQNYQSLIQYLFTYLLTCVWAERLRNIAGITVIDSLKSSQLACLPQENQKSL